jgi:D-mannonate dehydratase
MIADTIKNSFTHLVDLNLLRVIVTSNRRNIIVFAGGDHTKEVIRMLHHLKATTIYQAINLYSRQETVLDNGCTSSIAEKLPVTRQQILHALSAQPEERRSLFSYIPTMLRCAGVFAALYCTWSMLFA